MQKFNVTDQLLNHSETNDNITTYQLSNDKLKAFQDFFKQQTVNNLPGHKFHAVMLFYTEGDLGISNNYGKWINWNNMYFTNGAEALNYYSNTRCPASQLISADTQEDLLQQMNQMMQNYNNKEWLDKKLYPYL